MDRDDAGRDGDHVDGARGVSIKPAALHGWIRSAAVARPDALGNGLALGCGSRKPDLA
jgi:hypothetical protein